MSDHKKVLVQFKKTASTEEKQRMLDELRSKGAKIYNAENVNSKILPFVSISLPEQHFGDLKAETIGGGHYLVENVEEDKEMHISPI